MNLFLEHPALRLYALASAAIAILLVWLAFHTGSGRTKRRAVVNAEDVKVYRDASIVDIEHADVQRVKRAHANLLENAVPFLVLGLLYAMTEPSLWLAGALYLAFVVLRVLHVVFYLTARQPFRAQTYALGVLVTGVMLVQILRAIV